MAHLIDLALVTTLMLMVTIPLLIRALNVGDAMGFSVPVWVEIVVDLSLAVLVVLLWRWKGATPGKMMFRLEIVDSKTGERPSLGRLILRYFAYLVALVPVPLKVLALVWPGLSEDPLTGRLFESWFYVVPLGLGFLWIFLDPLNRGWHDLISRTVTISRGESGYVGVVGGDPDMVLDGLDGSR